MSTQFGVLGGKIIESSSVPTNPVAGQEFFDTDTNFWMRYDGSIWRGMDFTTTSTSSSTTSTSSSTTSTSSSTTSSTSSSTSTTSTSSSTTSTSSSTTSTSSSTSTTV